jgi:hypothetical protein
LEKDVDQVRLRADRDRVRLDAGTGPPRELEALQHELATLERRKGELEDAQLALMEQREHAQEQLDQVQQRLAALRETRDATAQRCDQLVNEIDKELASRSAARAPLAAALPAELVSLYERLRETTGIGAALLRAGRCEGCRLELSGSERARVKAAAPDEVLRCEECRRILVRTSESGL